MIAPPLCLLCRGRLPRSANGPALCARCRAEIDRTPGRTLAADGIDAGYAALPYEAAGRRLVHALKFSRLLIAAELGAALIGSRAPARLLAGAIIPVPAAPLRLARRGFDPAAELAGALGGLAGLEVQSVLRRLDRSHQRGAARGRRLALPPVVTASRPAPARVVLIDDVVTTGATLDACASALREAGARWVGAVALAAVESPENVSARVARPGAVGVEWDAPGH